MPSPALVKPRPAASSPMPAPEKRTPVLAVKVRSADRSVVAPEKSSVRTAFQE